MSKLKEDKKSLLAAKREADRKIAELSIPCSHTKKGGREMDIRSVKDDIVECNTCGCRFSIATIPGDEWRRALELVRSGINQLKMMSDSPKEEHKLISKLGTMDFNLKELGQMYTDMLDQKGKNNKKKNKNKGGENTSFYGASAIYMKGRK